MKILLSLIAAFFLLCTPSFADTKSDAAEIKDVILNMWTAVERGDVEGYLAHVHDDYTLFGENDIYLQSGKGLERESYTDYLARYTGIRTFMHQPQFRVRGDTAWVTYYWSDSGFAKISTRGEERASATGNVSRGEEGAQRLTGNASRGERFTTQGKSTRIFVKENGKWLCIHGHFTTVGE